MTFSPEQLDSLDQLHQELDLAALGDFQDVVHGPDPREEPEDDQEQQEIEGAVAMTYWATTDDRSRQEDDTTASVVYWETSGPFRLGIAQSIQAIDQEVS